jgi:hypothetical protein
MIGSGWQVLLCLRLTTYTNTDIRWWSRMNKELFMWIVYGVREYDD